MRAQRIAVDYAAHSAQIEALEEELLEAFAPISPQSGEIPFHSTVTGELLDTAELGAEYWYRNLRQTVRFEPVLRSLLEQGRRAFVEVGPHPVLAFGAQETIDARPGRARAPPCSAPCAATRAARSASPSPSPKPTPTASRSTGEPSSPARAPSASPCPPTPSSASATGSTSSAGSAPDVRAAGLASAEHPLLGAAIEDPQGEGLTLSGRLSLQTHPWLADHAVFGTVLFPGTAFVELALRAGAQVGAETHRGADPAGAPDPARAGAVQIQVSVAEPDEEGERQISIHSRPEAGAEEEGAEWTCHAQGILSPQVPQAPAGAAGPGRPREQSRSTGRGPLRAPRRGRASNTAPPSRASAPPGGMARSSSPRSPSLTSRPRRPSASACTRRCSTPPDTQASPSR